MIADAFTRDDIRDRVNKARRFLHTDPHAGVLMDQLVSDMDTLLHDVERLHTALAIAMEDSDPTTTHAIRKHLGVCLECGGEEYVTTQIRDKYVSATLTNRCATCAQQEASL